MYIIRLELHRVSVGQRLCAGPNGQSDLACGHGLIAGRSTRRHKAECDSLYTRVHQALKVCNLVMPNSAHTDEREIIRLVLT